MTRRSFIIFVAVAGCSPSNGRNNVFGTVTYDGKPIPAGVMVFEPDTAQGNSGPAAMLQFKGGQYKSESGRGPVKGPHRVRVQGFDGVADKEMPGGRQLFAEKVVTVDIPDGGGQVDIDVPAGEKK